MVYPNGCIQQDENAVFLRFETHDYRYMILNYSIIGFDQRGVSTVRVNAVNECKEKFVRQLDQNCQGGRRSRAGIHLRASIKTREGIDEAPKGIIMSGYGYGEVACGMDKTLGHWNRLIMFLHCGNLPFVHAHIEWVQVLK